MASSVPTAAARDLGGLQGMMKRNQDAGGHLRSSPFMQANTSSSSLEGMERPVRSFTSFIKAVPPHPQAAQKPLPPTPSSILELSGAAKKKGTPLPPTSAPLPPTLERTTSVGSWKAPADWYDSIPAPLVPAIRTLSPLLPEPSPFIGDMDDYSWMGHSPPATTTLLPIYERSSGNTHLESSRSPPSSPSSAPPTTVAKHDETRPSIKHDSGSHSPSVVNKILSNSDMPHSTSSPVNSIHTSITSNASTKEKESASQGIRPPHPCSTSLEHSLFDPNRIPTMDRIRPDHQYLRNKRLRALNKGSPLTDDSWEDAEMDDKTRQLSFSQDYHELLAEQYQEMNVQADEVLSSGGAHHVYEAQFDDPRLTKHRPKPPPKDKNHDLVPRPLSWQKTSSMSTPTIPSRNPSRILSRNQSSDMVSGNLSGTRHHKMHNRITSWVPRRLSVGPRQHSLEPAADETPTKNPAPSKHKSKKTLETKLEKALKEDLRFSKFFPPVKPLKLSRKRKSKSATRTQPPPSKTPPASKPTTPHLNPTIPSPLLRLPGGLAVIRHSPSPNVELGSIQVASPTPSQPTSDHSPISSPNPDARFSWQSSNLASESPVAPGIAVRRTFRTSRTSSYSQRSSASSSPSHPLAQEIMYPPRTPPPPPLPPAVTSPPSNPPAWNLLKSHNANEDHHHHFGSGFVEKALQVRRNHSKSVRQDRLKRSIRVLGPTDPGVVGSYVRDGRRESVVESGDAGMNVGPSMESAVGTGGQGRLPGYMVGGSV